jgi:hypothetical protein
LLSRIRLGSSPQVLTAAEELLKSIVDIYREPNLTPEQIRPGSISGEDRLKHFSDICRTELESAQRLF